MSNFCKITANFEKCPIIELKLQWIYVGRLIHDSVKCGGSTLYHKHQSSMVHGALDAGGKFILAQVTVVTYWD